MSKQGDLNEQVTRILEGTSRTLNGLTLLAASHEIRILQLEGKPIPAEVRKSYLNSYARAVEQWGDEDAPDPVVV